MLFHWLSSEKMDCALVTVPPEADPKTRSQEQISKQSVNQTLIKHRQKQFLRMASEWIWGQMSQIQCQVCHLL